jgi:hypothetical protein
VTCWNAELLLFTNMSFLHTARKFLLCGYSCVKRKMFLYISSCRFTSNLFCSFVVIFNLLTTIQVIIKKKTIFLLIYTYFCC